MANSFLPDTTLAAALRAAIDRRLAEAVRVNPDFRRMEDEMLNGTGEPDGIAGVIRKAPPTWPEMWPEITDLLDPMKPLPLSTCYSGEPLPLNLMADLEAKVRELDLPTKLQASKSGLAKLQEGHETRQTNSLSDFAGGLPVELSVLPGENEVWAVYANRIEIFNLVTGEHRVVDLTWHDLQKTNVLAPQPCDTGPFLRIR